MIKSIKKYYKIFTNEVNGSWSWRKRTILIVSSIGLGSILGYFWYKYGVGYFFPDNEFFKSSSTIVIFGLIANIGRWLTSTHDIKKESKDRFHQQNEIIFSNAMNLLHTHNNEPVKQFTLSELAMLQKDRGMSHLRIKRAIESAGLNNKYLVKDINGSYIDFGAGISRSEFDNAKFDGSKLIEPCFRKVLFLDVNFSSINITKLEFINPNFKNVDFSNSDLSKCTFTEQNIESSIYNCEFKNKNFKKANLRNKEVKKGIFQDSNFHKASFVNTFFQKPQFWECFFVNVSFQALDFQNSVFHNPKFENAQYNNKTKFPKGFKAEDYGMINVDSQ